LRISAACVFAPGEELARGLPEQVQRKKIRAVDVDRAGEWNNPPLSHFVGGLSVNSPSVRFRWSVLPALLAVSALTAHAAADPKHEDTDKKDDAAQKSLSTLHLSDEMRVTQGSASIGGKKTPYQAEAGVMVVYVSDPQDDDPPQPAEGEKPPPQPPEVGMSYVAYFKGDKPDRTRPITFLFNGGPGSATVWLHMGAFGPKRVRTTNDSHSPAAPYRVIDNEYSLLDVSDLVFIDAPGTGFGHLRGADKEKAFYGVDPDAHAFSNFIVEFLSRHGRWNSPKYLFGESYGTTRAAVLAYQLQNDKSLDLNGVIFLSQILCFDNSADAPQFNPSVDQPYVLALPTYAATAWYHKKLPNQPAELQPLLREVEQFALGEYAAALMAGPRLPAEQQHAIAVKLHNYTGLPVDYIERASLRINVGEFNKTLLGDELTAGRLDTRFSGPTLDPMSKEAEYDPQSSAISSAYVSAFNDYVRNTLQFGDRKIYKEGIDNYDSWDYLHQPPGAPYKIPGATNVMPDLASAMKQNPNLKVQMNAGYFDLATPYFAAVYELQQLPIPRSLQNNIDMHFYQSGHMVYAHEEDMKALHDNVAAFIEKNSKGGGG
jgi:carboxypeptidase C (cathepsin A)